ncbi:hypothetical protein ZHAS_00012882 [Anopheles sinensis]|uniref:Uncharacterized protein n=1 Tax=Anopheles sinensis TaxID=74873 RepID=A0A084W4B2_ANOSI|nr:hypothetical protein ZHAS_00012882 [Anopheles sinensis]
MRQPAAEMVEADSAEAFQRRSKEVTSGHRQRADGHNGWTLPNPREVRESRERSGDRESLGDARDAIGITNSACICAGSAQAAYYRPTDE